CAQCVIDAHHHSPFHRIKKWNGRFFEKTSLKELGFVLCLGHSGYACLNQRPSAYRPMIIMDINGYHHLNFMFCFCCDQETNEAKQLFHHGFFPATLMHPETVFTSEVLEQFNVHHCTSTKSGESFCASLQQMTNSGQPYKVSDSYCTMMQASHIHRHLQMVRRSGQAHNIDKYIQHRRKNCIAIHCPTCPEPG
ncbi:hypothetical protein EV421DRAFT_1658863, partial [Armillaria borealis]